MPAPFENFHTDQLGRTVFLASPPRRIVSLVPSQTQLLASLGLDQEVVGITRFCVHPKNWHTQKQRVGGTKDVRIDRVKSLKPDLVIGNKEENVKAQIEELSREVPVWISDIQTLDDALGMIKAIGALTDRTAKAAKIANEIEARFYALENSISSQPTFPTLYLIWKNPWMAAGKETFIDEMLSQAGLHNVVTDSRYPTLTTTQLRALRPAVVLLSSEPFPFKEQHIEALRAECPETRIIILADGEPFSWYGSTLLESPAYFQALRKKITALLQT